MEGSLIAGIDAGGTTFKLGIAERDGPIVAKSRVATTTPAETISATVAMLRQMEAETGGRIEAVGVASFGPLDIDPSSSAFGTILQTPKAHWSDTPLLAMLSEALGVPVSIDTDVNAALRAELAAIDDKTIDRAAYITVGTGIGVGVSAQGRLAGFPSHPELGHIRVERHPEDQEFSGVCAFHGGCLEGLVSAPALEARFGALETLPEDHVAWEIAGHYLAQLCMVLCAGFRLQRILIGGGVSEAPGLILQTRKALDAINGGYLPEADGSIVQKARLGADAGLAGALFCAPRAK